ncbi:cytochrome b/b6 domain-containing protein [Shewanella sp. SNU WT4]|uniref:cytochrome b/b6 domain-containing protein n=1 Tax=Shewanella sp. SNU WT4 TaxID=2590015 RepID=UPI00143D7128|nr:cytochrome b/b6 domain-containing protein [Shewanella sp. SNU WT4]
MATCIKVWDKPTRLFHWLTIGLLASLWWTADQALMDWHQVLAYSLMVLVVFRIIWGCFGSETSRFSHFVKSPIRVMNYSRQILTSGIKPHLGHNPLGGYMVIGILTLLTIQLATGLFASDEVFTEGPLYASVSAQTASWLTWLHKWNFNLILACSAVHVLAVGIHRLKGDALIGAMITGSRQWHDKQPHLQFKSSWLAWGLIILLAVPIGYGLIWPVVEWM